MKPNSSMDLTLSIIAAVAVLFGTGLGFYLNYKSQHESKTKQIQIENLNKTIDKKVEINSSLSSDILDLSKTVKDLASENLNISKTNVELAEENKKLASKTLDLSEQINNIQTGGDSFIELIAAHGPPGRTVQYWVMPHGEFVLRSVSINIVDNIKHRELLKKLDFNSMSQKEYVEYWNSKIYKRSYKLGNIMPSTVKTIEEYPLDKTQNEISLLIDIFAENGTFRERIRQIDLWGTMLTAIEIRNSNNEIIYEKVSDNFPRNEDGSVEW